MEDSKTSLNQSFQYRSANGHIEPIILAHVRLPGVNNWSEKLEFLVDTGYNGDVLLNSSKFEEYQYNLLGVEFSEGETVNGSIVEIQSIPSIIKIDNFTQEVIIESITRGNEENLIGFNFLLDLIATFDGPNNLLKLKK